MWPGLPVKAPGSGHLWKPQQKGFLGLYSTVVTSTTELYPSIDFSLLLFPPAVSFFTHLWSFSELLVTRVSTLS